MNTTTETYRPYRVDHNEDVGTILDVEDVDATIPEDLLPRQVSLASTYVKVGGCYLHSWFAIHDTGMIKLPVVPGDGSQDLRQLVDWLTARGYREITDEDDPDSVFVRAAID